MAKSNKTIKTPKKEPAFNLHKLQQEETLVQEEDTRTPQQIREEQWRQILEAVRQYDPGRALRDGLSAKLADPMAGYLNNECLYLDKIIDSKWFPENYIRLTDCLSDDLYLAAAALDEGMACGQANVAIDIARRFINSYVYFLAYSGPFTLGPATPASLECTLAVESMLKNISYIRPSAQTQNFFAPPENCAFKGDFEEFYASEIKLLHDEDRNFMPLYVIESQEYLLSFCQGRPLEECIMPLRAYLSYLKLLTGLHQGHKERYDRLREGLIKAVGETAFEQGGTPEFGTDEIDGVTLVESLLSLHQTILKELFDIAVYDFDDLSYSHRVQAAHMTYVLKISEIVKFPLIAGALHLSEGAGEEAEKMCDAAQDKFFESGLKVVTALREFLITHDPADDAHGFMLVLRHSFDLALVQCTLLSNALKILSPAHKYNRFIHSALKLNMIPADFWNEAVAEAVRDFPNETIMQQGKPQLPIVLRYKYFLKSVPYCLNFFKFYMEVLKTRKGGLDLVWLEKCAVQYCNLKAAYELSAINLMLDAYVALTMLLDIDQNAQTIRGTDPYADLYAGMCSKMIMIAEKLEPGSLRIINDIDPEEVAKLSASYQKEVLADALAATRARQEELAMELTRLKELRKRVLEEARGKADQKQEEPEQAQAPEEGQDSSES